MISYFWFRRDLRLEDNTGFAAALMEQNNVVPLFIFDAEILNELPDTDARVNFIYERLILLRSQLKSFESDLRVEIGNPRRIWEKLLKEDTVVSVYTNRDYEPYALERDAFVQNLCEKAGTAFCSFKDQVVFEPSEILKPDGKPYTVFTPYKNKWLEKLGQEGVEADRNNTYESLHKFTAVFPTLSEIGFVKSSITVPDYTFDGLEHYDKKRDIPALKATSYLSTHLRFGTVSVRHSILKARNTNATFLSELIWREFFMQILYHVPSVVEQNYRSKYNGIPWRNDLFEFKKWCEGNTGYPLVDAGMRELNATGLMHNRVRMVTASFLCKHLLIDWRWGEAYFAQKLLDYDLSANNGNWQWAAGTGCDAAPYFRIFNPSEQMKKFDPNLEYVLKWVPEYGGFGYPEPMVDHKMARERALEAYKIGIQSGGLH